MFAISEDMRLINGVEVPTFTTMRCLFCSKVMFLLGW